MNDIGLATVRITKVICYHYAGCGVKKHQNLSQKYLSIIDKSQFLRWDILYLHPV